MKIKIKHILIPVIVFIILVIICWAWVFIENDDVLSAFKCSFVVAALQGLIIRINEGEFKIIDTLGFLSIFFWIVSLLTGVMNFLSIVWIVVTAIFYCVAVYKNYRFIQEIREIRDRLHQ